MSLLRYLPALVLLATATVAHAQNEPWYDHDPLPQAMTAEEMTRRDEIGLGFTATAPPVGPVRNIAEFERSEAVLIRYPLGIPLALVAALSEHVRVITLVASQAQQSQAASAYQGAGVNMANAAFLIAPTNSIWTRDYGPFYIADGNDQVGLVDFSYNRPRPGDNAVPVALGAYLNVPVYAMDLVHTGGNYMTDSRGIAASTDLVWEENGFNQTLVLQRMADYLGLDTYHVRPDPQGEYIRHIDTWAKFLDVDKVLIAEVPANDSRYADYEAVAAYFAAQTSAWGTPYQVVRVYTPNDQPYTNALIVNERVYVPIVNSSWDQAALDVYEAAMPGYEILPFTGSWLSTDALHCRIKEIADREMLYLRHQPVAGEVPYQPEIEVEVDIVPYSGLSLREDELFLIYRADAAPFDTLALQHAGGDTYAASLPVPQGADEVSYYFSAADASGRTERFPLVGPEGARSFHVLPAGGCEQTLAATLDDATPAPGQTLIFTVTVANNSAGPATLDLWLEASRNGNQVQRSRIASGTLPAGASVTRAVPVRVPGSAPSGSYDVRLAIGDFAADDECAAVPFAVTVSASLAEGAGSAAVPFESGGADFFSGASVAAAVTVAPNPFSDQTQIRYTVSAASAVRLAVYDVLGREVAVLVDGRQEAGAHAATLDARGLAAGTYLYRLTVGRGVETGRLTLAP